VYVFAYLVSLFQNITTIRLPFMLFDALGLIPKVEALLELLNHYDPMDLMFVTQTVGDALWGATDTLMEDLLSDLQAIDPSLNIPIAKFDRAPGACVRVCVYVRVCTFVCICVCVCV
jgi:hypothetical protein